MYSGVPEYMSGCTNGIVILYSLSIVSPPVADRDDLGATSSGVPNVNGTYGPPPVLKLFSTQIVGADQRPAT